MKNTQVRPCPRALEGHCQARPTLAAGERAAVHLRDGIEIEKLE